MSTEPFTLTEEMARRAIRQGKYRVDLWEQALGQSAGDTSLARAAYVRLRTQVLRHDVGCLLAGPIRQALASDAPRRMDVKSARDLRRQP